MTESPPGADPADFSLTDDALRSSGRLKWSVYPEDVLPAWVADLDLLPSTAVSAALREAVGRGLTTYPALPHRTGLPEAFCTFSTRRYGWQVDPARVVLVGDVMAGLELTLRTLCEPGAIALPVPNYGPFFDLARHLGRPVVPVPHVTVNGPTGDARLTLDPDALERAFAAGATVLLLSQPQNPLGRAFDADELGAWVAIAGRHGARVVSDEIWGPLCLDPGGYVPAASVPGAEGCVTAVVGTAKTFNLAGLKSALIVATSAADARRLTHVPVAENHGTSSLGIVAAIAAYREGGEWLDSLLDHLRTARAQLERLLAVQLPGVTMPRPEATFLAWLDTTALGLEDPHRRALERGRVALSPGGYFDPARGPGSPAGHGGHVRLNFGTSLERLDRIVAGLRRAWYD